MVKLVVSLALVVHVEVATLVVSVNCHLVLDDYWDTNVPQLKGLPLNSGGTLCEKG